MSPLISPENYPFWTMDKVRFGDTDKLGHVNNAVFSTFLETGRVDLLCHPTQAFNDAGTAYVLARLTFDFRNEIAWPGEVRIGTRILAIGRSSLKLEQIILQGERCAGIGETTLVQMNETTRKSQSFSDETRKKLENLVR